MNETPQSKPFEVPKGVTCPRCGQVIVAGESVTQGQNRFRKGLIIVCASCSCALRVGDSSLIPMTLDEIKSLDKMTQAQLLVTCRRIAAELVKKN